MKSNRIRSVQLTVAYALCLEKASAFFTSQQSFVRLQSSVRHHVKPKRRQTSTLSMIKAPPGSGYLRLEDDEESAFPDTYEPMMEYPGTMRPGRTPENQPYSSLPIQESDPDPVPWPHFQEIEWHHNWGAPHDAPIPMEEFIEMQGRWATAEMEAEMRAGARRGVRERRELEESQKAASFILDDDDEDDEVEVEEEALVDLGQGVDLLMNSAVETPTKPSVDTPVESDDNDDDDNFLLDLGLDTDEDDADEDGGEEPAFASSSDGAEGILEAMQSMIDAEESTEETESDTPDIDLDFDDLGLSFDEEEEEEDGAADEAEGNDEEDFMLMEDDDLSGEQDIVPLDDMIGNEDMGDDDEFDDGGFDFGD